MYIYHNPWNSATSKATFNAFSNGSPCVKNHQADMLLDAQDCGDGQTQETCPRLSGWKGKHSQFAVKEGPLIYGRFHMWGIPQNGWFTRENPVKPPYDDLPYEK